MSLDQLKTEAIAAINAAADTAALDQLRVKYLGKQGVITEQMKKIGGLAPEERKAFGATVNQVKEVVTEAVEARKGVLETAEVNKRLEQEWIDVTLPLRAQRLNAHPGKKHPITQVIEECTEIFRQMGFAQAEGPEIETEEHNFTALNIPEEHPARQMHDTFYFSENEKKERNLLRTHTSTVQIRYMRTNKPPYKIIAPGRVYRCDSDMTHSPMFHQIEGLYIDKNITMAHLKGCLIEFIGAFFGKSDIPVRFRPSFFPFTEPSAEVDIGCWREAGILNLGTAPAGKEQGWLEVLGAGMVHPKVLENVGVNPKEWQGFAFGLGVERFAMLKYGIPDLRTFFDSDVRWLRHYGF